MTMITKSSCPGGCSTSYTGTQWFVGSNRNGGDDSRAEILASWGCRVFEMHLSMTTLPSEMRVASSRKGYYVREGAKSESLIG